MIKAGYSHTDTVGRESFGVCSPNVPVREKMVMGLKTHCVDCPCYQPLACTAAPHLLIGFSVYRVQIYTCFHHIVYVPWLLWN